MIHERKQISVTSPTQAHWSADGRLASVCVILAGVGLDPGTGEKMGLLLAHDG